MSEESGPIRQKLLGADFDDNPEIKRILNETLVNDAQAKTLRTVKIVFTILLAISFIVGLVVVLVWPASVTLTLKTFTDYRDNAAVPVDVDGYPKFKSLADNTIGLLNVGQVAVFISLLAAIGYGFNWAMHKNEMTQMNAGANPYIWLFQFLWHFLLFMVIAYVAGISNVYVQVFLALSVWGMAFLSWGDDLLNSRAQLAIQYWVSGANGKKTKEAYTVSGWMWLPTFFVWAYMIVIYTVIIIYIVNTFANSSPQGFATSGASIAWLISISGVFLFLYLFNPIMFAVYKGGYISIYTREMFYYIFNGIVALAGTWMTLGFFALDGIAPDLV